MSAPDGEFREGWPVLLASFLGIAAGVSSLYFYSLGIFIKPLAEAFGWSRGAASLSALVGTGCAALAAFPTGRLVDRFGSVPVGLISLALLSAGFAALGALTAGLTSFLVITALLSLTTAGSSPLSFTRLVVVAFVRRRGLALGLILSGTGVGAILVPALLSPYVAQHGWRAGYLLLSAIVPMAIVPIWLLLRKAHDAHVAETVAIPLRDIVTVPAFRLIGAMFFLGSVAILGTIVQFVPMLTDAGFTPGAAGRTAALIGVSAIGGRVVTGLLLDRFRGALVAGGLFAFAALGLLTLAVGGPAFAVAGAMIAGVAIGAEVDLIAFLTCLHFPQRIYGRAYGALYALYLIGGAIGPAMSGYLYDLSGSYRLSLSGAAVLLVAAALISVRLARLDSGRQPASPPVEDGSSVGLPL